MTVDRTHVLATPGMDAHGSYVALSRHRKDMNLHYGRDDFGDQNRLVRTLSRDRAKDMATDYEPAQTYAERRGISFRERVERVVEIVSQIPERVRDMFDGLRLPSVPIDKVAPGAGEAKVPERERGDAGAAPRNIVPERSAVPEREVTADPEAIMRQRRTDALVRHARAADAIIEAKRQRIMPSNEQRRELGAARDAFEELRPHGWQDAEAAYSKDNSLAHEAGTGRIGRTIRALQLETEIRTGRETDTGMGPAQRADRFVQRWQALDQTSQRQYEAGDIMAHKATRREMGDMVNSLKRDPQLESLLANRKRELGISFDSDRRLGDEIAFHAGIDLGRGRGIGI